MRKFFTKKRIIWTIIILVVVLPIVYFIFRPTDNSANIQTDVVKKQDLKSTVLATGQVTSQTDLSLGFKTSGMIQRLNVKVGDLVKQGQILASLDNQDASARLTQSRGVLAQAQANYQKVIAGTSDEQVAVAQVALDSAKKNLEGSKKQQETLVANAYKALLNSTLSAVPSVGNAGSGTLTVSGFYNATEQGVYKVTLYISGNGMMFQSNGLEVANGEYKSVPVPLGTKGLSIDFSDTNYAGDIWTITIPNTSASNYVTNYNAYQAALQTQRAAATAAENEVAAAQANLDLQKATARPGDIAAAQAQVLSAQGQVQAAEVDFANTVLRAPANGTITKVDAKIGQQASALQPLIMLQDVDNLHVEANISEANISSIKQDQPVELTLDALGEDRKFTAKVQTIDPASTVVSGVVNYKVKVSLEKLEQIKPGMTANLNILTGEKAGVLAMPMRAVISKDGKKIVRVIEDPKKKTYKEVEVTTGMEADGGLVEVLSGVSEGQEIVTFVKS